MNSPSIRFAVASPQDDPAIRRLLRDNPMAGSIRLRFEREPDYFSGVNLAGADDETIVASSGERLVCMGRCSRRECWVNGQPVRVGYLAELRLDGASKGRFAILRDGYRFFHARPAAHATALHFTSIASDNKRARRVLESGARGLPQYRLLGELATVLVPVPRRARAPRLKVEIPTPDNLPAIADALNAQGCRHQLATVWTAERLLSLEHHGLPLNRFLVARHQGEIVACGGLWDQRPFRQTVIRGYSTKMTRFRPWINLAARLCRFPVLLPAPGTTLPHAFLSPLAVLEKDGRLLTDFVAEFLPLARQLGIEFLTLALPAGDPRLALFHRFSTRLYRSRLYRVDWPDEALLPLKTSAAGFLPDVALL